MVKITKLQIAAKKLLTQEVQSAKKPEALPLAFLWARYGG